MRIILKAFRHCMRVVGIHLREAITDIRYTGFYNDSNQKMKWRLLMLAHSLEKGMGMENGRADFGLQKAQDLLKYIRLWGKAGLDTSSFEYQEALSVLTFYIALRASNGLDIDMLALDDVSRAAVQQLPAGCRIISSDEITYRPNDFAKLCMIRHSTRMFDPAPVTREEIDQAIDMMKTAPSACNRQMIKVYCAMERAENERLAQCIPGNKGFENSPDKYLFFTADRYAFDENESGQWYMNGGIYTAYLQLALTACNIGSCIFQWPKDVAAEKRAKVLLGIPDNEVIVSVLGVGHYKKTFAVLKSAKKSGDDFICYR